MLRVVAARLMKRSAESLGVEGVGDVESTIVGDGSFGGGVGGVGVFSGTVVLMRRPFWL